MMNFRFAFPRLASTFSIFILLISALLLDGCKSGKDLGRDQYLTTNEISISAKKDEYRSAVTRDYDLLHTSLSISFDWERQYVNGTASLLLKPFFYPSNTITLDAVGFNIQKVETYHKGNLVNTTFSYDSSFLVIALDRTYTRNDTFEVKVVYTAKPNELPEGGSAAITSDKGVYFINPAHEVPGKPRMIWTQCETQAASKWFPTLDRPNERCTQEMFITVEDSMITLSNGQLIDSKKNDNGTRTDHWVMLQPHAPYLFMMAVGNFAKVSDNWKGIPVDYYVEPVYAPHARGFFGNTPEMMEFLSNKLGVIYPWNKYAQVAVRDFVSGAMENTTASIFLEEIQRTERELLDYDLEYIVMHELMHQWFGDLVTCESWSNITLNEGFANYSEYLWAEYKYGYESAEEHRLDELRGYLREAENSYQEPLIRYYYNQQEDVFDAHSYNKGGLVLHMLRKHVGDEAFFKSLQLYLNTHRFSAVEVHDLRLAFEKITGEDLSWFFNQWYLTAGHPVIECISTYDPIKGGIKMLVTCESSFDSEFRYRIPTEILISESGKMRTEKITIEHTVDSFFFQTDVKPDFVYIDPYHSIAGVVDRPFLEDGKKEAMMMLAQKEKLHLRIGAIISLYKIQDQDVEVHNDLIRYLTDESKLIRTLIAQIISFDNPEIDTKTVKETIYKAISSEKEPRVRSVMWARLAESPSEEYYDWYKKALQDSSYEVIATGLDAIFTIYPDSAYQYAKKFENEFSRTLSGVIAPIFAEEAVDEDQGFFEKAVRLYSNNGKYSVLSNYCKYLQKMEVDKILKVLPLLEANALYENRWFNRYAATDGLYKIYKEVNENSEKFSEADKAALLPALKAIIEKSVAKETEVSASSRYQLYKF